MRIVYTALRNLASGHTVNNEYELVQHEREALPNFETIGKDQVALDGSTERDTWREEDTWRIDTGWIHRTTEWPRWKEFLSSVSRGEQFEFDPDSSISGLNASPRTCRMETRRFRPRAETPTHISYQFEIREV